MITPLFAVDGCLMVRGFSLFQVRMNRPVPQSSQVEIVRSGQFYTLLLGKHISLSWDRGTHLLVHISASYRVRMHYSSSPCPVLCFSPLRMLKMLSCVQGHVCGLCGNFDGNVNNDMMSSNNQMEVDSVHFGNSWKVAPSCADVTQVVICHCAQ